MHYVNIDYTYWLIDWLMYILINMVEGYNARWLSSGDWGNIDLKRQIHWNCPVVKNHLKFDLSNLSQHLQITNTCCMVKSWLDYGKKQQISIGSSIQFVWKRSSFEYPWHKFRVVLNIIIKQYSYCSGSQIWNPKKGKTL